MSTFLFKGVPTNPSSLFLPFGVIALSLALSCARNSTQLDYSELLPILKQNNLNPTNDPRRLDVAKIEEADSMLYQPLAGTTIYLESPYPTFDSETVRPRYLLRVEDFTTRE